MAAELDLAVGRVDRVVRGEGGMVEHAVTLRRGDQQQGAGDRALHTVGRAVADLKLRGALALGGAGGGTAAVEKDRIHHALRIQERNLLIDRHADRVRALAAVGQEGHDRAVADAAFKLHRAHRQRPALPHARRHGRRHDRPARVRRDGDLYRAPDAAARVPHDVRDPHRHRRSRSRGSRPIC